MATARKQPGGPQAGRPGEVRLGASIAALVALALYATLPNQLLGWARIVVPGLGLLLLVPLIAINPVRMDRQTRLMRGMSIALAALLVATNSAAFVTLVHELVAGGAKKGTSLLVAALQVWLTNIIAFALLYWEIDRGGPVLRAKADRDELPPADFRFSQDENDDTATEVARRSSKTSDWRPRFVDYLYLSTTNSTAFSPTDTMPLSPRAKMLMSVESIEALLVSVLVIARGVSLLK
ncbi:MAG: DUF1345 domain-containing protein [Frankiaceae bacterium]|nr:DUF1345 domain-containing protein [Frankiaceae bacterium]